MVDDRGQGALNAPTRLLRVRGHRSGDRWNERFLRGQVRQIREPHQCERLLSWLMAAPMRDRSDVTGPMVQWPKMNVDVQGGTGWT
jgi:hypothetical protein